MVKAEDLVQLARDLVVGRDNSVVQTEEAIVAINEALVEVSQADDATADTNAAVQTMKELVAAYSVDSDSEALNSLINAVQTVASLNSVRLVEVGEAQVAIEKKVRELSEAQLADEDYAAKMTELQEAAAQYTKETDAPPQA